jgi:hypothetical protein
VDQASPAVRLRYGGSARSFGFAIYSSARDRYEDALLLTRLPTGSLQEALDTACTVRLAKPSRGGAAVMDRIFTGEPDPEGLPP